MIGTEGIIGIYWKLDLINIILISERERGEYIYERCTKIYNVHDNIPVHES